jgi:hypothetical protein
VENAFNLFSIIDFLKKKNRFCIAEREGFIRKERMNNILFEIENLCIFVFFSDHQ